MSKVPIKVKEVVEQLETLAIGNYAAAVKASTFYTRKMALARATSYQTSLTILKEVYGLYKGSV